MIPPVGVVGGFNTLLLSISARLFVCTRSFSHGSALHHTRILDVCLCSPARLRSSAMPLSSHLYSAKALYLHSQPTPPKWGLCTMVYFVYANCKRQL